ncbi:hypothetical protein D1007_15033 [Hordeum vulgare]|nr:hypothetical protein D1007_15033 [Hordeum vulgare]
MTQLEAEIWIQNMENHFGSNLISRKYEVEHALQYFTQSASIWWKMHHAIQGFSGAETWDEFKNTLLRSRLIRKCYDNPKEKTCACKICGAIGHTQEEHKDGCTHCEENHPAEECPSSQQKDAVKETLKKKVLEGPVMNENIEDPDGQGLTRFFSNACYSCGEEGHYSQDCMKRSQEYLGYFPMEEVEFDPLEMEELAKMKESRKKNKYPRKNQISADIDLSHGMQSTKGYPFMENGVELWYVEVHLHHVKGVCPKTMGQYFFISRVPRATFFDAVREAAMEAIRQIGEILEARLHHTQEYLSEVHAEMMEMKFMTTMMKRKMDDFREHLGNFEWN